MGRETAEVADTGDGDGDETVEELPHTVSAERHLGADRLTFTKLETAIDLPRSSRRLLTRDEGEIGHRVLEQRGLLGARPTPMLITIFSIDGSA